METSTCRVISALHVADPKTEKRGNPKAFQALGCQRLVQRGTLKRAGERIVTVPRVTRPRKPFKTKCLVCLRQADLPLCSRALDASALRGASVAITTAGPNVIGLALRHPCCHDTNTNLAPELHPHASVRNRILAIENKRGQIFNRTKCCGEAEARSSRRSLWNFDNVDFHLPALQCKRDRASTGESEGRIHHTRRLVPVHVGAQTK